MVNDKYIKIFCFIYIMTSFPLLAQEEKPINTAFPFLLLSTDAVSSGRGGIGVCTPPDVFSQQWNASKYVFASAPSAIGLSYLPYLSNVIKDVFLGNITFYKRTNRSAWAGSFTYFTIGDVALTEDISEGAYQFGNVRPSEFSIDFSYSLKLDERFSMGVVSKYLQSSLYLPSDDKLIARGFAFDISGYYISNKHYLVNSLGEYILGFQLSNIGSKIKYTDLSKAYFIPTNLKIGGSYNFSFNEIDTFSLFTEINKLLVPSVSNNVDFLEGMIQSFTDAPKGFSEELHEIDWALAGEYSYKKDFFLRTGYHHQHKNKGANQFISIGVGVKYQSWKIDFGYIFSTVYTHNSANSGLKISLQYQNK